MDIRGSVFCPYRMIFWIYLIPKLVLSCLDEGHLIVERVEVGRVGGIGGQDVEAVFLHTLQLFQLVLRAAMGL